MCFFAAENLQEVWNGYLLSSIDYYSETIAMNLTWSGDNITEYQGLKTCFYIFKSQGTRSTILDKADSNRPTSSPVHPSPPSQITIRFPCLGKIRSLTVSAWKHRPTHPFEWNHHFMLTVQKREMYDSDFLSQIINTYRFH